MSMNEKALFLTDDDLVARLPNWKRELGLVSARDIVFGNVALLVLDMQNEFLTTDGQMPIWGGRAVIPHIGRLIEEFRRLSFPIFYTQHICVEPYRHQGELAVMQNVGNPACFLAEGSFGVSLIDEVKPASREKIIEKYRYSAFFDTPLETLLRVNNIEDIIVTGVATNICCETTAHDAYFRGFRVFFPIDACGGTDESAHLASAKNIALVYGTVLTTDDILSALHRQAALTENNFEPAGQTNR